MAVSLDRLWQWWRDLAKRELELERQYNPLVEEHGAVHKKRMALENLMAQGQEEKIIQQIASEWAGFRKAEELPSTEPKPADAAYDVLSRNGNPMHYREILKEVGKHGVAIGGRDPGTTLIAYLGRDGRFVKARELGRGYWKLKQWEEESE